MTTEKNDTEQQPSINAGSAVVEGNTQKTVQGAFDIASRSKRSALTIREARLIRGIVAGKTKRQAARDAGYGGSNETVSVTASKVLKKANVKELLQEALEKHGVTVDGVVQVVADGMKATKTEVIGRGDLAIIETVEDHSIRLRAGAMASKLLGLEDSDQDVSKSGNTFIFNQQNNLNAYMRPKDD